MLDDQTTFLVLVISCLVACFFLNLTSPEREIIERKVPEEEMTPYLLPKAESQNKGENK